MKKNKNIRLKILLIGLAVLVLGGFSIALNSRVALAYATSLTCAVDNASVISGQSVTFTATPSTTGDITYIFSSGYGGSGQGPLAKTTYTMTPNQSFGSGSIHVDSTENTGNGRTRRMYSDCPGVTVNQLPTVTSFSASPSTITAGQSATLSWTTTNATAVSIADTNGNTTSMGGAVGSGSLSISPTVTTGYTITATGPGGTVTATAAISVSQTGQCAASSPSVSPGGQVTFTSDFSSLNLPSSCTTFGGQTNNINYNYSFTNAGGTTVSNSQQYTALGLNSSVPNGYYTAHLNLDYGSCVTLTQTSFDASCPGVIVTQPAPIVTSFSASPSTITAGQSATLSWTSTNASSVSIDNGVGAQSSTSTGRASISPSQTTTYTITATGAGGTATQSVTVTVNQLASAPTVTISASPATITAGQSATLSWTSTNASSVSIDNGVGAQSSTSTGRASISPSQTTTYTITATNSAGAQATASVTVNVTAPQAFTISINDTSPSNSALNNTSIFTVGDPFAISGGPTDVNDYSIAPINSSGGEGQYFAPGALSGNFGKGDVGLWKIWVSGANGNPMISNPVYFAVIQPPVQPSQPQPKKPTAALEIDCNTTSSILGKVSTTTLASLTIDPAVVVPPAGVTLTLNSDPQVAPSGMICEALKNNNYDSKVGYVGYGYSNSATTIEYPTTETVYGLSCYTQSNPDVCSTGVNVYKNGQWIGKGSYTVQIFGGSTGGIKEIAPQ